MDIEQPATLDILDTSAPGLSTTSDMPVVAVVEDKPDAPAVPPEDAPAEDAEAHDGEAEQLEDSATSTTEDDSGQPTGDRRPRGVGKKIAELTARAEAERTEKLRLLALVEELSKPKAPEQPPPQIEEAAQPVRPNRADFADPEAYEDAFIAYTDARTEWKLEQKIQANQDAEQATAQERQIEEAKQKVAEQFHARVDEYKASNPDYADVVESRSDVSVPTLVAAAITHSDKGPALLHHFGKHPEAAAALFQLNPVQMLVEVGRIEASLTAAPSSAPAPAPKPVPVSAAPKPISPIKASSEGSTRVDPETESPEAYATRRRKELGYGDPLARRH